MEEACPQDETWSGHLWFSVARVQKVAWELWESRGGCFLRSLYRFISQFPLFPGEKHGLGGDAIWGQV